MLEHLTELYRNHPHEIRVFKLPSPFKLWRGEQLLEAELAYETYGELNSKKSNAILIFPGLSGSAHVASGANNRAKGWWESIVGPMKTIDTTEYFVICVNALGSCHGSTGPLSINPKTKKPYGMAFPHIRVEDTARAARALIKALGIKHLNSLLGVSMGAMNALAYAALVPGCAHRLISVSGTLSPNAQAIALHAVARDAIMLDPAWREGAYDKDCPPVEGLKLARKIGLVSYRNSQYFEDKYPRPKALSRRRAYALGDEYLSPGHHLQAVASRNAHFFDANSLLYLTNAIDRFNLNAHGSLERLFSRSGIQRALVLGVSSDTLYPTSEQQAIHEALLSAGVDSRLTIAQSTHGHNAFLSDAQCLARPLRAMFFSITIQE